MRAWLKLFNAWMPDFLFDNHVTDGSDIQYDVTWDMARYQDIAESAREWVNERFVPELNKRMAADGIWWPPTAARCATSTHSLKSGKTRAWANCDIMAHSIEILVDPEGLKKPFAMPTVKRWIARGTGLLSRSTLAVR